jgi:chloramphenicol-sensitive protein RarD
MPRPGLDRIGLLYGLGAYGLWGLMPLYFKAVTQVSPFEVLAHRIVWCAVFLAGLLVLLRRWPQLLACLHNRRYLMLLGLSSFLIAVNWYAYILGASTERIVQTSLGYFMTPLVSVGLGMLFFRENLRPGQWLALSIASCGLIYLISAVREPPWIALSIASSFGLYGLVRKVTPVDSLSGLLVETLLLCPIALPMLVWGQVKGTAAFGQSSWPLSGLLMLSGLITAIPLLCFGQAARRLPLSILAFLQYIAPSIQLLLAVNLYGEPFDPTRQVCFGLIWTALAVFSLDSLLALRRARLDTADNPPPHEVDQPDADRAAAGTGEPVGGAPPAVVRAPVE